MLVLLPRARRGRVSGRNACRGDRQRPSRKGDRRLRGEHRGEVRGAGRGRTGGGPRARRVSTGFLRSLRGAGALPAPALSLRGGGLGRVGPSHPSRRRRRVALRPRRLLDQGRRERRVQHPPEGGVQAGPVAERLGGDGQPGGRGDRAGVAPHRSSPQSDERHPGLVAPRGVLRLARVAADDGAGGGVLHRRHSSCSAPVGRGRASPTASSRTRKRRGKRLSEVPRRPSCRSRPCCADGRGGCSRTGGRCRVPTGSSSSAWRWTPGAGSTRSRTATTACRSTTSVSATDSVAPAAAQIGDYTNVTNIGLHLIAVAAAYELDFLSRTGGAREVAPRTFHSPEAGELPRLLLQLLRHHVAGADQQLRLLRRLLLADRGTDGGARGVSRSSPPSAATSSRPATTASSTMT